MFFMSFFILFLGLIKKFIFYVFKVNVFFYKMIVTWSHMGWGGGYIRYMRYEGGRCREERHEQRKEQRSEM